MYTQTKKFRETKNKGRAKCKYCKSNKVHWIQTEHGWLLFDKKSGKRHNCKEKIEWADNYWKK